jgi:Protein of unknown function (DUF3108)
MMMTQKVYLDLNQAYAAILYRLLARFSKIHLFSLILFISLYFGSTGAVDAAPVRLTYNVYTGGINAIDVTFDMDITSKSYTADLTAYTRGFLGKLVPWKGKFKTVGQRSGDTLIVRSHESISTWKGKDDRAVYKYSPNGTFQSLKLIDDGMNKTPDKIDSVLTKDTTDILTATLNVMMNQKKSESCDGASDIFDSRRRFTLKFSSAGSENLKKSRYNMFNGKAQKCTVEVIPKGGAWSKKPRGWLSIQEQGRKKGSLPTVWTGKIIDHLPPMPVKILIKTNYGTMFLHLVNVDDGKSSSP